MSDGFQKSTDKPKTLVVILNNETQLSRFRDKGRSAEVFVCQVASDSLLPFSDAALHNLEYESPCLCAFVAVDTERVCVVSPHAALESAIVLANLTCICARRTRRGCAIALSARDVVREPA